MYQRSFLFSLLILCVLLPQTVAKGFDWRNRASVHTETVAKAMITNTLLAEEAKTDQPLVEIIRHADILKLGID